MEKPLIKVLVTMTLPESLVSVESSPHSCEYQGKWITNTNLLI
jgi:hypothetical protein